MQSQDLSDNVGQHKKFWPGEHRQLLFPVWFLGPQVTAGVFKGFSFKKKPELVNVQLDEEL